MTISRKFVSVAAIATFFIFDSSTDAARAEIARLNAGLVASLIENAFRGTSLRLNNYGPRHGDSWHVRNDSLLRLGVGLGGHEIRFNIPEVIVRARVKLPLVPDPKYTARYYISDVNLQTIDVSVEGAAFKTRFNFESRGTELKGRCTDGCVVGSDDTAPDFQINRARIDIFLTPAVYSDGIAYTDPRAVFSASVDARGIAEFFDGRIKTEIKSNLEPAIVNVLNNDRVKQRVYAALRPTLDGARIGVVRSARIEGGNLVIEHTPRR